MSDVEMQTGGTPKVQPFTRADAVLTAWSHVCACTLESLAAQGESVRERALPGIAVHLLRNDLGMKAEEVALKLGVPTIYVRLLTIETARTLASQRVPGVPIRAKMARVREAAKVLFAEHLKRTKPERDERPERKQTLEMRPKGRRGGRRKPQPTPVDEAAGMEVVEKVAPLFRASATAVRGPNMSKIREASWARMTVMSLLHCVVTPRAQVPAIAQFFGVYSGSVYNALGTIERAANWQGTHMYKHAIVEACRLYGVKPSALKRCPGNEVTTP